MIRFTLFFWLFVSGSFDEKKSYIDPTKLLIFDGNCSLYFIYFYKVFKCWCARMQVYMCVCVCACVPVQRYHSKLICLGGDWTSFFHAIQHYTYISVVVVAGVFNSNAKNEMIIHKHKRINVSSFSRLHFLFLFCVFKRTLTLPLWMQVHFAICICRH